MRQHLVTYKTAYWDIADPDQVKGLALLDFQYFVESHGCVTADEPVVEIQPSLYEANDYLVTVRAHVRKRTNGKASSNF